MTVDLESVLNRTAPLGIEPCAVDIIMCGRYNIVTDAKALMDAFGVLETNLKSETFTPPRYNIAPSTPLNEGEQGIAKQLTKVPVVRVNKAGEPEIVDAVWPLIPTWGKGKVPKYSTANARSETMAEKPAYRHAWQHQQRCLFVMSGYYEWKTVAGQRTKLPFHIGCTDRKLMGVAGLWEVSNLKDGDPILSATIVTCGANELMNLSTNRCRR